jgi:hypothetical protein
MDLNTNTLQVQAQNFNKARGSLIAIVFFSGINMGISLLDSSIRVLFSATTPELFYGFGRLFAEETGNLLFLIVGLVLAMVVIGFYFLCWILSERKRVFMLIALIAFGTDALVFVALVVLSLLSDGFEVSSMIEIAIYGWILFSLISGTIAWSKLRGISAEEYENLLSPSVQAAGSSSDVAEGAMARQQTDNVNSAQESSSNQIISDSEASCDEWRFDDGDENGVI